MSHRSVPETTATGGGAPRPRKLGPGARPLRAALLWKEFSIIASRPSFWLLRSALVASLLAVAMAAYFLEGGLDMPRDRLVHFGESLARILCATGYAALVVALPALVAGAFEEEKQSGTLEVLASSPLSEREVLVSVLGGRLLIALVFVVGALPLFAVPLWTAGPRALAILAQAFLSTAMALVLALLYALGCETSRRSFGPARGKTLLFIVCTPAAGGIHLIAVFFVCLAALHIFLEAFPQAHAVIVQKAYLALWFPFWGIGLGLLDRSWLPGLLCGTLSAALRSTLLLQGETHRLRRSLRGYLEDSGRRERRSTKRRRGRKTVSLESVLGAEERPSGSSAERGLPPSFSQRLFQHMGAVERWALRATGGNPWLAKSFLERRAPSFPLLAILALVGSALLVVCLFAGSVSEALRYARPLAGIVLACTLFGVLPSLSRTICRMAPPGSLSGFRDILLSSPLGARQVITGALCIGLLRNWPLLVAVVLPSILVFRGMTGSAATLALVLGLLLVGSALALWMAFLWKRTASRVSATHALFTLLVVPPLFLPSASTPAELRPLSLLLAPNAAADEVLRAAGGSTLLAVLLLALFAGSFERLAGRR